MYNEGISREGELLDLGIKEGLISKSGAWIEYQDKKIGQGREATKQYLKDNPKVAQEIEEKVKEKAKKEQL